MIRSAALSSCAVLVAMISRPAAAQSSPAPSADQRVVATLHELDLREGSVIPIRDLATGSDMPLDTLGRPMLWKPTRQPIVVRSTDTDAGTPAAPAIAAPTIAAPAIAAPAIAATPAAGTDRRPYAALTPVATDAGRRPVRTAAESAANPTPLPLATTPGDPVAGQAVAGSPTPDVAQTLQRRGTITFRKTPLQEVVFMLSDLWQINIVAGDTVSGDVSGSFHDTPLREVLPAILSASGYGYRQTGNSLVILPLAQIGADDPEFVSQTLPLPPGSDATDQIVEAAKMLLSERGQLLHLGGGRVLIKDQPERITQVRELLVSLGAPATDDVPANPSQLPSAAEPIPSGTSTAMRVDDPLLIDNQSAVFREGIAYFTLQYTEAEQMQESLQAALGTDTSSVIAVFKEGNRVMVRGTDAQLRMAAQAIEQLDVPRSQVRITALIYDVEISEIERLGLNWSLNPHSGGVIATSPADPTLLFRNSVEATTGLITDPAVAGASNIALRTMNNNVNVGAFLQALNQSGESKLLADPSITVGDRREASIKIVKSIPFQSAVLGGGGAVANQVQFEEAGVILTVTPRIGRDDTIEMVVQPEYSVQVGEVGGNPIIDRRNAQTTVRVGNGQMFVLGGLRQKNITETIRGVPFLKDIKYVGKLFRNHDTVVRESELIVFITPELITPYSTGSPRQQRAACVTNAQLDAIPHATVCPMSPYCRDKNCPNHHPRPRVNGGSAALDMIGDYGLVEVPLPATVHHQQIDLNGDPVIIETTGDAAFPPVRIEPVQP